MGQEVSEPSLVCCGYRQTGGQQAPSWVIMFADDTLIVVRSRVKKVRGETETA